MKYVLGIDSGGTKYLVKAADLEGGVLASHTGPSAAHHRIGAEEAFARIEESLAACLACFAGRAEDCAGIVVGTTGLDHPSDEQVIAQIYQRLKGFTCPIGFANDARVALQAATGGEGVVVIAGTGSIAFGMREGGQTAQVGGWPPCIGGDEGSGSWIAAQALRHLSHVLDGRHAATRLSEMLAQRLSIHSGEDLIALCIRMEKGTFQNPGISQWVNEAAQAGDESAARLLEAAARETASLVLAVARRLEYGLGDHFAVGAWGSAIVHSPVHFAAFEQLIHTEYPAARVCIAQKDAADGALEMALARWKEGNR